MLFFFFFSRRVYQRGKKGAAGRCSCTTYSGIKEAAADAVHCPHGYQQRKPVGQGDKDGSLGAVATGGVGLGRGGGSGHHEMARVAKEEEHEGADELAQGSNKMQSDAAGIRPALAASTCFGGGGAVVLVTEEIVGWRHCFVGGRRLESFSVKGSRES